MNTGTLIDLKQRQHETWSSGSYRRVAWLTVPLADALCDAVDLPAGATVLDVATGTGHVALAAARRFCTVTGIDYVPELLADARDRAAAEGLSVEFAEADAEMLPFPDGSFDVVLSAIGVMFTADHQQAARELVRVCRPGGRIGMINWTPDGFIGQLLKVVGRHAPPPPGASPPTRWGAENVLRELLSDSVVDLTCDTEAVRLRFPSTEFFADFLIKHYGPTRKAAERLTEDGRKAFSDDLIALAGEANKASDGTAAIDCEYLTAVATRASG